MADVKVPMLNSNDEQYILIEWLAADGTTVATGDPIAVIETSKAANELTCQRSGVLRRLIPAMAVCRQGDVIAQISGTPQPMVVKEQETEDVTDGASPDPAIVLTDAARDFMREHGLSISDMITSGMATSGRRLIRLTDVKSALGRAESSCGEQGDELPRQQQAVARVVSKSHATIPSAFLAFKVSAPWITRSRGVPLDTATGGIPDHVISAVAAAANSFPIMFAHVSEDLRLTPAKSVDIGVTVDIGKGLTVPVVRRADEKSVTEISAALMALRVRARRGKLSDEDLTGARIVVALQQEPGVMISTPIVYPGTVCSVSVGALDWEVVLDDTGLRQQAWFTLGISYDHRVVNGREAAAFLAEVRDCLAARGAEREDRGAGPAGETLLWMGSRCLLRLNRNGSSTGESPMVVSRSCSLVRST
jgi:2-oxoglutarate dehydrogenase E2 component (dihydrolipoamide succinyltransferase)